MSAELLSPAFYSKPDLSRTGLQLPFEVAIGDYM